MKTAAQGTTPHQVLLASPNLGQLDGIPDVLRSLGVHHLVVPTTSQAIEVLEEDDFAAAIIDMSGTNQRNGFDLAHHMARQSDASRIVMVSDSFLWIPATSPLAGRPVLLRPVNAGLFAKSMRAVLWPQGSRGRPSAPHRPRAPSTARAGSEPRAASM